MTLYRKNVVSLTPRKTLLKALSFALKDSAEALVLRCRSSVGCTDGGLQ